ncbi:MAG: hypothetical protein IPJ30_19000 [Acidobacteria bacterium]|nr:hypothetical protein [Acidobacteriota bacterium]
MSLKGTQEWKLQSCIAFRDGEPLDDFVGILPTLLSASLSGTSASPTIPER